MARAMTEEVNEVKNVVRGHTIPPSRLWLLVRWKIAGWLYTEDGQEVIYVNTGCCAEENKGRDWETSEQVIA